MTGYKIGDKWSSDFDYEGMLLAGMNAQESYGPEKLMKLFRSFEDVNYHTIAAPLYKAIKLLKAGKPATRQLEIFKNKCKKEFLSPR